MKPPDRSSPISGPRPFALGPVGLTVANLERSVTYYRETVGLHEIARDRSHARLGSGGRELVEVVEIPGAQPTSGRTGLFHLALLLPTRADLAGWLERAGRKRIALTGLSDHTVSEAIYLTDPDGLGIELYADRPPEAWRDAHGRVRLTTTPLDVDDLMRTLEPPHPMRCRPPRQWATSI